MLASDMNNPDFVGARNPDSALYVQFYARPVENAFQSEQQKRPIFDEVDFVKIQVPGDKTTAIDTPVREEHKTRFPIQWANYQNHKGQSQGVTGTPITEWPRISATQAEELKGLKFFTVESIAGAADSHLRNIGMIAGTSVYQLRDDARRFLQLATENAQLAEAEKRAREAEEKMAAQAADFQSRMDAMQEQMAQVLAAVGKSAEMAAEAPSRQKPGPKPKQEA